MAVFENPKQVVPETHLGEAAAQQPLSGIARIDDTAAVSGNGRGGFVRHEEAEKTKSSKK